MPESQVKYIGNVSIGPSFWTLAVLLLIGLKLTHYIAWSWWWVLAPVWVPFAAGTLLIVGVLVVFLIAVVAAAVMGTKL